MKLQPHHLEIIGATLYGQHGWQTALARALGKSPRTVRYWVAGEVAIPEGVAVRLERLLALRARDLHTALTLVNKALPKEAK